MSIILCKKLSCLTETYIMYELDKHIGVTTVKIIHLELRYHLKLFQCVYLTKTRDNWHILVRSSVFNVCYLCCSWVLRAHQNHRRIHFRKERHLKLRVLKCGVLLLALYQCVWKLRVASICSSLLHRDQPGRNEILCESDLAHAGNEMHYARLGLRADSSTRAAGNSSSSPALCRIQHWRFRSGYKVQKYVSYFQEDVRLIRYKISVLRYVGLFQVSIIDGEFCHFVAHLDVIDIFAVCIASKRL